MDNERELIEKAGGESYYLESIALNEIFELSRLGLVRIDGGLVYLTSGK